MKLRFLAAGLALAIAELSALAESGPDKLVRLVVP